MVQVQKRGNERVESMLRRFKRHLQKNGSLYLAREKMHYEKKKSRNLRRKAALKRSELREEKELARKKGKLDNQFFKH